MCAKLTAVRWVINKLFAIIETNLLILYFKQRIA